MDLSFCEPVFVEWIMPLRRETLPEYAARLKMNIASPHPIVVGVSFGGMLVSEMAKKDPQMHGIIISSNKISAEFPAYLRVWKNFPVYNWVSPKLIKLTSALTRRVMGPKGATQQKVFREILEETDPAFTAWAVDAILKWENKTIPQNVVHIHGTADRLLPYKYVSSSFTIDGGSHLMIMDKAYELSTLLKQIVDKLTN